MTPRLRAIAGSLLVLAASAASAQTTAPAGTGTPPLGLESLVGSDSFRFYCASCHGADAKGAGPVAGSLKTPPANLTTIQAKNGGSFPRDRLVAFVTKGGAAVAAHGSPEMPVWGPIFLGLDPSAVRTKVRIDNLVAYIESLQAR
jgi:mono/diheme cytochrome c family protein